MKKAKRKAEALERIRRGEPPPRTRRVFQELPKPICTFYREGKCRKVQRPKQRYVRLRYVTLYVTLGCGRRGRHEVNALSPTPPRRINEYRIRNAHSRFILLKQPHRRYYVTFCYVTLRCIVLRCVVLHCVTFLYFAVVKTPKPLQVRLP